MYLQMNAILAQRYTSASQKVRVLTESWVSDNLFCPRCGHPHIARFRNNQPVADFYCPQCSNQFELKSKSGVSLEKIPDGAYSTMIDRITGLDNPDFFFMSYSKTTWCVQSFFFVPKHFFTPAIIEKRTPLSSTAKRAGWIGCNILLSRIPSTGRIPIIENGVEIDKRIVMKKASIASNLEIPNIDARGWLFDVLSCVERIPSTTFPLSDLYGFEKELSEKHPDNHNVRPKIRQQLQLLRDKGVLEFVRHGVYRKLL